MKLFKYWSVLFTFSILLPITSTRTQAQSWIQLNPNPDSVYGLPAKRFGHTAVYDATHNLMTIFAGYGYEGYNLNDVWVLSNSNGLGGSPSLTQLNPNPDPVHGIPTPRNGHTAVYDTTNNRMTIFGGSTSVYGVDGIVTWCANDVWVLSNANGLDSTTSAWTQLSPNSDPLYGYPTPRYSHTAVYDAVNNRMTIFGGSTSVGGVGSNDVWVLSNANGLGGTPTWTQLAPSGNLPAARKYHAAVYDNTNNIMIIFGGNIEVSPYESNDIWILSNANGLGGTPTWAQLIPTGSTPDARSEHTAVYDITHNRMTIFGGYVYGGPNDYYYSNDVWVLNYANGLGGTPAWTQLIPTGSTPDVRSGHTAVYDATHNLMTIFGGDGSSFSNANGSNDVWVFSTHPQLYGVVYYNDINNNGIVDGGNTLTLQFDQDMQVNGAVATDFVLPVTGDSLGTGATVSLNTANDTQVIITLGSSPVLNVTGQFNSSVTTAGSPSGIGISPTIPSGHIQNLKSLDAIGGTLVGIVSYNPQQSWTQLLPISSIPAPRFKPASVYDSANNRMITFAGEIASTYLNDVWVLSHADGSGGIPVWTQLNPTPDPLYGLPTGRYAPTAVYDATHNLMTIFGGNYINYTYLGNFTSFFNDVWVLSNANGQDSTTPAWTQLSPTGTSQVLYRYAPTAVYDTTNNIMMIFGGYNGLQDLNDVWVLSNANGLGGTPGWTQLSPTGGPPAGRNSHTAVYDNINNQMTIFGGFTTVPPLYVSVNDVWVLSNANGLGGTPTWTQLSPTPDSTQSNNGYMGMPIPRASTQSNNDNVGLPIPRAAHTAIYNPVDNQMIIFAGLNNTVTYYNDVWMLSNANGLGGTPAWTQLNPNPDPVYGLPTTRSGHTAVYNTVYNRMTIFGGSVGITDLNDSWVFRPSAATTPKITTDVKIPWELFDRDEYWPSTPNNPLLNDHDIDKP